MERPKLVPPTGCRTIVSVATLLLVAGCRGRTTAPRAESNAAKAPSASSLTTDLQVWIANNRAAERTCAGVAPRRYVITLDGRDVASVDVPCTSAIRAPSPIFEAKAFAVPPGRHRIGVRDSVSRAKAVRELGFPVVEEGILAEKLLIDGNGDDSIEIGGPEVFIKRL
jgi:hypothetical protein